MTRRGSLPVVGVLAGFAFGLATTLVALSACQPCGPTELSPFYRVVEGTPASWVPDTVFVEVDDDTLLLTYETLDGASWEVEFREAP